MQRGRYLDGVALVATLVLAGWLSSPGRAAEIPGFPGWDSKTFGDTLQGSASVDANGVITINGAGADTWEREDEFHIVYKPLKGDGSVTTRVLTAPEGHNSNKIGVIMRNDLENPAAAAMQVHMTTIGLEEMHRGVAGEAMGMDFKASKDNYRISPRIEPPFWLKIDRRGNLFTPYVSQDGALWIPLTRPQQLDMKEEIVAGIYVCSHVDDELLTATFDGKENVTDVSNKLLKPEEATPVQPNPINVQGGNNSVTLSWNPVDHLGHPADGYVVYKRGAGDSDFVKLTELTGDKTSYVDENIKNGEKADYRVTTVVKLGDRTVESRDFADDFYSVTGAPNPSGPLKIGDRQYNASILAVDSLEAGGLGLPATEIPGSASIDDQGVVTLKASGPGFSTDWNGYVDGGELLMTPINGDFTFTARLVGAPTAEGGDVGDTAKFGIAVRESAMNDSRYAGMLVTPNRGVRSPHRRLFTSGRAEDRGPNENAPTYPVYLRIQRRGDEIKLFTSADGTTFTEYGDPAATVLKGLPQNVFVGFMGTSGDSDQVAQARFDKIELVTP